MSLHQARWAAVGAAIAVSVGSFGLARAVVDTGAKPVFVPITPCRIMDTRDYGGFNVGPRSTPIGSNETYAVHAAGGVNGECDSIPATAVGLVMNVTITDPTRHTYLTIWPTDQAKPNASNLNALAGKTEATPNLVTTDLAADGSFSVFNFDGTVNVIADVAGYYEDHNHDDRYYTEAESDANFLTELEGDDLYVNEGDQVDGAAFHSGAGSPAANLGDDGDMYFDVTGRTLYGPKVGANWGSGTALAGGSLGGQSRSGILPLATVLAPAVISLDALTTSFGAGIIYDATADQFTVADAGVYRVSYNAHITAGLIGTSVRVRVNGTPVGPASTLASVTESLGDTVLLSLAAGDLVDLSIGGAINISLAGSATFTIERVS